MVNFIPFLLGYVANIALLGLRAWCRWNMPRYNVTTKTRCYDLNTQYFVEGVANVTT